MGLISSFGSTYEITRFEPGDHINGIWVNGAETQTEMIASIQPLSPYEVMKLPEGSRSKEMIKIYTTFALRATIESLKVKGDRVSYRGRLYEVRKISEWEFITDIPHFKALAVLVEVD